MSGERDGTEDSIAEATSHREEAPAVAGATLPQAPEIPAAPQQPSLVELQAQIEELRLDKANAENRVRRQCSVIHRRLKGIENRASRQYSSLYRGIQNLEMLVRQLLPPDVRQQFPPLPPADPELERLTDEEEDDEESEVDEDEDEDDNDSEEYEDEDEDDESEVDADVDDCSIEYEDKEFEASDDDDDDDE